MENDETTAGSPQTPAGERPRRRSRRAAAAPGEAEAPTPANVVEAPAPDAAATESAPEKTAPRRASRSRAKAATTGDPVAVPATPRARRTSTPDAAPETPRETLEETAAAPGRRPARPRRGTRAPALSEAAAGVDVVADEPATAAQPIADAPPAATAPVSAPDAAQEQLPYPEGVQAESLPREAEEQAAPAPVSAEQRTEHDAGEGPPPDITPAEQRSTSIAAGFRRLFSTLPDPDAAALQPTSFLRGLAAELRAAGVQPATAPSPQQVQPALQPDADDVMGDVSQSLADLDLEHVSMTAQSVPGIGEAAADEGGDAGDGEADKAEERQFGRRRRRRGGRGRGGLAGRLEAEGETADRADDGELDGQALDEDDLPLALQGRAPAGLPAAVPAPAGGPAPQPSWKDRGPRRPWLAPGTPGAEVSRAPAAAAPPRVAPTPERDRREADPFGVPAALSTLPLTADPLGGQEGGIERALERQSALLQTFLERQSRLLEAVVNSISVMRRSVEDVMARQERMAGEQRAGLPRTGIFVDAPNVCYAADAGKVSLDFSRMLSYLSRGREVVHAIAYAPISEEARDGQRFESQRFVAPFARKGFKMVTKPLKRYPDGTAKGNFDIELAIDIVTMSERLDVVVLVSGDSDFSRLVELVQSKGVRVEVVAFSSSVSTELVHMADVFVDIGQNLDSFRQL